MTLDRATETLPDAGATTPASGRAAPTMITVSLVNDYEVVLQGLHAVLAPYSDRIRVVEHEVGGLPDVSVDVALFDTFGGRRDALDRAHAMICDDAATHVVLYTWDAAAEFLEIARNIGVAGVILKSATGDELVRKIESVVAGQRVGIDSVARGKRSRTDDDLSAREREVLALVALGYSNREIANELFVSIDTVKTYLRRLFAKLGVNNRTQAAILAGNHGVAPPPGRRAAGSAKE